MLKKLTTLFFDNSRIMLLVFLIIFTAIMATFSAYQKKLKDNKFDELINNTYLKKTLREIVSNLEPRYKTYNHKIKPGETFDKILKGYSIDKEQVKAIKENLSKKNWY